MHATRRTYLIFFAYVLLFAISLHAFKYLVPIADYFVQFTSYSKIYCVNLKMKNDQTCKGKCHLTKKIKETSGTDKKSKEWLNEWDEYFLISERKTIDQPNAPASLCHTIGIYCSALIHVPHALPDIPPEV